jgi:hypothetical protein
MSSVKSKSYFVLFEYAECDSLCRPCLNKCLKNQDHDALKNAGEVLDVTPNNPSHEYAKFCDFCEREIIDIGEKKTA